MGKGGKQIALDKNGIFFLSLFSIKVADHGREM